MSCSPYNTLFIVDEVERGFSIIETSTFLLYCTTVTGTKTREEQRIFRDALKYQPWQPMLPIAKSATNVLKQHWLDSESELALRPAVIRVVKAFLSLATMADQCIPANPDISGIGVRTATYVQNILCFAPIVAHLWDGKVTIDEITGIKDQSIGMLAIAFAILISTAIEAKGSGRGQSITNFHAAVVLDLSWMNNTSTFIWFLLYAHHRSINEDKSLVIPVTWSGWLELLFSPLRRVVTGNSGTSSEQTEPSNDHADGNQSGEQSGDSRGNRNCDTAQDVTPQKLDKTYPPFVKRLWELVLQAPV